MHLDSNSDPEGHQLSFLLNSFDMLQHVRGATHIDGHTLDLVVSRATDDLVQTCEVGTFISDHNSVLLTLKSGKPHPIRKKRKVRKIKSIISSDFANDISASVLSKPLPSHVDDIVSKYNTVLQELLDKHAPVRSRSIAERPTQPWMDDEILEAKRIRRQCERRWRNSSLTVNRHAFKDSCEEVKKKIREAKSNYFIKQIKECDQDQRKLFKIVDNLLGRAKPSSLPEHSTASSLAEIFNEYFVTKISNIRTLLTDMETSIADLQCPPITSLLVPSPSRLSSFKPASVSEITSIIKNSSIVHS